MYDGAKILTGLAIFLVLITVPFWYNGITSVTGMAGDPGRPDLELPEGETDCIRDGEWMRHGHMQLLDDWRDEVVRDGERYVVGVDGKTYEKSLTLTCLGCHTSKTNFCDRCHDYAAEDPYCWECHVVPETDIEQEGE